MNQYVVVCVQNIQVCIERGHARDTTVKPRVATIGRVMRGAPILSGNMLPITTRTTQSDQTG